MKGLDPFSKCICDYQARKSTRGYCTVSNGGRKGRGTWSIMQMYMQLTGWKKYKWLVHSLQQWQKWQKHDFAQLPGWKNYKWLVHSLQQWQKPWSMAQPRMLWLFYIKIMSKSHNTQCLWSLKTSQELLKSLKKRVKKHPQDQLESERAGSLIVLELFLLYTHCKFIPTSIKESDSCVVWKS